MPRTDLRPLIDVISPRNVSKYHIRMLKLRGRLFNEYVWPPLPYNISRAVTRDPRQRDLWASTHFQNEQVVRRWSQMPADFDETRTLRYYPAHPQISDLMSCLRQHGLYRDEHADIKEEMSRLRALRGKPDRVWREKNKKNDSDE